MKHRLRALHGDVTEFHIMIQRHPAREKRIMIQILSMLESRDCGTICPSEVSRKLAIQDGRAEKWRGYMDAVHAAVDALKDNGEIELSWKSTSLTRRVGPYRISAPLKNDDLK